MNKQVNDFYVLLRKKTPKNLPQLKTSKPHFFPFNYNNPLYIESIHMCNTIFACFCPSESINNKYDGAQSRRLLLQFYSLIRNLC
jgi:hypothetical protein